ncbi:hypothetical protein CCACVL1_13188 [Corchorus capsularis]|uniref:Uncharacterized protein n=1 Tax=Corchorus capsularis TaxID=210143 RepID=A0A1R3IBX4_COCAP|nr:hypothetical protein CCACVL1_13188 [Corchorus capsularis]
MAITKPRRFETGKFAEHNGGIKIERKGEKGFDLKHPICFCFQFLLSGFRTSKISLMLLFCSGGGRRMIYGDAPLRDRWVSDPRV